MTHSKPYLTGVLAFVDAARGIAVHVALARQRGATVKENCRVGQATETIWNNHDKHAHNTKNYCKWKKIEVVREVARGDTHYLKT